MFSCLQDPLIYPLVTASSVFTSKATHTSAALGLLLNCNRSSEKNCSNNDGDDIVLNEELAFQIMTIYAIQMDGTSY